MKLNKIIVAVCFSLILIFASGADMNPIWVTLLGMFIPMGILYLMTRQNNTESEESENVS